MNILVTGATGFLGSHIVKELLKNGHKIIILKRSFSNTQRINSILDNIFAYDIDKCSLEKIFKEQKNIDVIIHTATCYGRKNESITKMQQTNTAFPLALIEKAIKNSIPLFINTDTALDKNINSYAFTKKQFVEWGKKLADEKKISFINLKLEHFYGPGDDNSKFVTYIIEQCRKNVPEIKLTKGEQKRDFIYIEDVVNAYMKILEYQKKTFEQYQEYDIGTGESICIQDFVKLVKQLTNSKTILNFGAIPYRKNEIMNSCANIKKLKLIGWEKNWKLDAGLSKIIRSKEY